MLVILFLLLDKIQRFNLKLNLLVMLYPLRNSQTQRSAKRYGLCIPLFLLVHCHQHTCPPRFPRGFYVNFLQHLWYYVFEGLLPLTFFQKSVLPFVNPLFVQHAQTSRACSFSFSPWHPRKYLPFCVSLYCGFNQLSSLCIYYEEIASSQHSSFFHLSFC